MDINSRLLLSPPIDLPHPPDALPAVVEEPNRRELWARFAVAAVPMLVKTWEDSPGDSGFRLVAAWAGLQADELLKEYDQRFASVQDTGSGEKEEPCMLFLEMLDRWFRHERVDVFTGTCAELLSRMEDTEGLFSVEERYTLPAPSWIGRRLSRLQTKYPDRFSCEKRESSLVWTIGRPQP